MSSVPVVAVEPDQQALAATTHGRQDRAVDALGAEHVHVTLLGELLGREGLDRAEHHVTGVVDDDIDLAAFGKY